MRAGKPKDQNRIANIFVIELGFNKLYQLGAAINLKHKYSQICIKRSPLGEGKSYLLRQVTS
jgi:hypothetical protein